MGKSKVMLKRHIFIDMSSSSSQSVDLVWTVDTSCSTVTLFIVGLLNPSRGIFVLRITGNSDYKKRLPTDACISTYIEVSTLYLLISL
jgi:hypothetical protein